MVIAESERESRPESSTNSASRLQWLRQRREALQEKLIKKNNELKNLCIDEAELTGVLPPEIPLDPGESPPLFRRRVGTSFAYPQNLINKLKTSQAEESALELERQIQTAIAKKAYVIFNDTAETKAVRRKHRLVYQQSQGRLKDLEIRLNFIRQGYGRLQRRSNVTENTQWQQSSAIGDDEIALSTQSNVKHRSKKPRPPLDSGLDRLPSAKNNSDKAIKNNGIDQLSVANDWQYPPKYSHNDNRWIATNGPISSCVNSGSDSAIVHDLNDNTDVYIVADQCRARTYSHGNSDDGDSRHARHYQMIERGYRTISGGHDDEDDSSIGRRNNVWSREQKRQYETYHYNQRQQQQINAFKQQPQKYYRNYHQDHLSPVTNESPSMQSYPELLDQQSSSGPSRTRYTYYPPGQYSHLQNNDDSNRRDVLLSRQQEHESVQDRNLRRNNHESIAKQRHEIMNSNDNWISPDEEESVWHSERLMQQSESRFGSIDRRKQNETSSSTNNIHRYQTTNQEISSTAHPTTPVSPRYIKPTVENKTISKYMNNQQQHHIRVERIDPPSARTLIRTQSLGSVETWHSSTSTATTAATTCPSPVVAATIITMQPTGITAIQSTTAGSVHRVYNRDNHNSYRENSKEWYETSMDFSYPKSTSVPQPPKTLEIPAESSRLSNRREMDMNFDSTNLTSPEKLTADGRTIVHAGKYQPYKEVTKPFEMSDFYKYSTKFRKKVEPITINQGHHIHSTSSNITPTIISENNNKSNNNDIEPNCDMTIECRQQISTTHAPLVQRRICNSAQSMPGQPYITVRVDDNNIRDWTSTQASQPTTKDSTVV
ncbi:hypothetical protein PV327_002398 [Microctonus hyperodae]|uniref:Cytohesin Ubiquitin Protein Inducing domain-containing protein n=1 Tax=Microctonus hyperodae TaxID=165561 RepID=A0AA39FFM0_MICHY|nr:hypothetical protein PV327_002398 [Microctonus hyperodae]